MINSTIQAIKSVTGAIEGLYIKKIDLKESFPDFSGRFIQSPGTIVLMSGGDMDCARHHILAANPWLSLTGRGRNMTLAAGDQEYHLEANPFDLLKALLNAFTFNLGKLSPGLSLPIGAGLLGYLAYDLKDHLEKLPRTSVDDLCLPQICLFAPSIMLIHDKQTGATHLVIPKRSSSKGPNIDNDLEAFQRAVDSELPAVKPFFGDARGFTSNFQRDDYIKAIEDIKEYIASGHVYQVNMSQRFEMGFQGDPFSLFRSLFHENPAPFFAFINAGSHHIVSTSPERFILRTEKRVETRPIKGTRPRGAIPEEDQRLRQELLESRKDEAELSMIVDLLRNDLGKVCEGGTVRVREHKRLEPYQNVYHLVSIVEGILSSDCDSVDLIAATFPGGSITGCPKIRAMEIIDELEPHRRHIYTGSIGYISFHDTMDLSIAIRTATIINQRIVFSAGGGIVIESSPENEFDETLHKGRTLMNAFIEKTPDAPKETLVWINGSIRPTEKASVPVTDPGFQYGYGLFETIRVDNGKPLFLQDHIERLNHAWKHVFQQDPPDLTWDDIIDQVIRRNQLDNHICQLKILATKGDREEPPFNHAIVVMARPYTHRLAGKKEKGLNLLTYREPRTTPLADYKTLNYLFYFMAGKWALKNGGDEALVLNPDMTVSETNTGNILLIRGKTVTRPVSSHALPGTMEKQVCRLLAGWGYEITEKWIVVEDLMNADLVLVTNALMGAVPALSVDGKRLPTPQRFWEDINMSLFPEENV